MSGRGWCLVGLLSLYAVLDYGAVRVWRSEAALWAHAYAMSPTTPRVARNYARVLMARGEVDAAIALVNRTR